MWILMVLVVLGNVQMTGTTPLSDQPTFNTDSVLTSERICSPCVEHPSNMSMTSVFQMIKVLNWNQVVIFFDTNHRAVLQQLLPRLDLTSVYDLADIQYREEMKHLLLQLHKNFFPRLHFLLLSNDSKNMEILHTVDQFDMETNKTTDFRHFSFWFVVSFCSQCEIESSVFHHISHLENVAFLLTSKTCDHVLHRLMVSQEGRAVSTVTDFEGIKVVGDVFPNSRYGLNNRTLSVSILLKEPYAMKRNGRVEGYFIDILDSIATSLNFSYEIVYPPSMRYGTIENGQWDGLVGQLQRREVDIGIGDLTIYPEREEVMDFLYPPILSLNDDIMYRQPENREKWQLFLRLFHPLVLSILYITLVTCTLLGYIMQRYEDVFSGRNRSVSWMSRLLSIGDIFFNMSGMLFLKGVTYNPTTQSSRLLLFTWGVFSVITAACYSANLTANFAVHKANPPFTNLKELVRQREYKWGYKSHTVRDNIFNVSRTLDMQLFLKGVLDFNKTDPDVLSEHHSVHISKVKTEKYAYLVLRPIIRKARSDDCRINIVGQDIIWHQCGIGVPTGYPLSKELDTILSALTDNGLLDIWLRRWDNVDADHCLEDPTMIPLTLTDVASACYLLCVGLGAAGVVLVSEVVKHRLQAL